MFEQMMNSQGRYHQTAKTQLDWLTVKQGTDGLGILDIEEKYVQVQTVMLPSIIITEH